MNENGPLPGQALADGENDDDEKNEDASDNGDDDGENADGENTGGGSGGGEDGGGSSVEGEVVPLDLEPEAEDPATGFEYEGEARETKAASYAKCAHLGETELHCERATMCVLCRTTYAVERR